MNKPHQNFFKKLMMCHVPDCWGPEDECALVMLLGMELGLWQWRNLHHSSKSGWGMIFRVWPVRLPVRQGFLLEDWGLRLVFWEVQWGWPVNDCKASCSHYIRSWLCSSGGGNECLRWLLRYQWTCFVLDGAEFPEWWCSCLLHPDKCRVFHLWVKMYGRCFGSTSCIQDPVFIFIPPLLIEFLQQVACCSVFWHLQYLVAAFRGVGFCHCWVQQGRKILEKCIELKTRWKWFVGLKGTTMGLIWQSYHCHIALNRFSAQTVVICLLQCSDKARCKCEDHPTI